MNAARGPTPAYGYAGNANTNLLIPGEGVTLHDYYSRAPGAPPPGAPPPGATPSYGAARSYGAAPSGSPVYAPLALPPVPMAPPRPARSSAVP